ncbi:ABC transporter permease [Kitasatospora sp. MAP5-34]|uniref:ABC transporter permease n=1 Tax=Kitasatospora sp. MAP5-34 TaxID=3035102 RepID=UPI0024762991|nr:ABC transporter permease [Kitasatospora sp. MAP5-34]
MRLGGGHRDEEFRRDLAVGTTQADPSPIVAEPRARFGDLLAAEWIKIRSLRSTPWTLTFTALFAIGSSALAAMADYNNLAHPGPGARRLDGFLCFDAYPPAGWMTLVLAAGSVGTIAVVSEYGSGLIRTTTVAVPARESVMLAKAVVVAAIWAVVGTAISLGSFLVSQAILSGQHAGVPITYPGALRAMVASALVAPVSALVGLGIGILVRHIAAGMVTTLFILLLLPTVFSQSKQWSADIFQLMVTSAWKRLVQTWGQFPGNPVHIATVAESWAVYAIWPLATIGLALLVVRRRDV